MRETIDVSKILLKQRLPETPVIRPGLHQLLNRGHSDLDVYILPHARRKNFEREDYISQIEVNEALQTIPCILSTIA